MLIIAKDRCRDPSVNRIVDLSPIPAVCFSNLSRSVGRMRGSLARVASVGRYLLYWQHFRVGTIVSSLLLPAKCLLPFWLLPCHRILSLRWQQTRTTHHAACQILPYFCHTSSRLNKLTPEWAIPIPKWNPEADADTIDGIGCKSNTPQAPGRAKVYRRRCVPREHVASAGP